jgi:hypothetical protein
MKFTIIKTKEKSKSLRERVHGIKLMRITSMTDFQTIAPVSKRQGSRYFKTLIGKKEMKI